jgi:hypothetical protein
MRFLLPFMSALACALAAPAFAAEFALVQDEAGGFVIERSGGAAQKSARGLATIADLVPLLLKDAAAPEKVDFSAGKKLEGTFSIVVEREDGSLGRYKEASDVIIFAAPTSIATSGDITTFAGAVVFALKIDNEGAAAAVQRFETGAISLTTRKKSL